MLLNEFLKEHRKVGEQHCKLQEHGATIARLEKQIRSAYRWPAEGECAARSKQADTAGGQQSLSRARPNKANHDRMETLGDNP